MSQSFTDSVFQTSAIVSINLTSANTNFAALKSCFSGDNAPGDEVPGNWWYDTTNDILKLRNDTSTWDSVWDFANNAPVIEGLKTIANAKKITLAMMDTASRDPAAGTAGLRSIGTTGITACAGNDSRLLTATMIAGTTLVGRNDPENISDSGTSLPYRLAKSFSILQAGTYTVKFDLRSSHSGKSAYGRIYRINDSGETAVGTEWSNSTTTYSTKSQDIGSWVIGDTMALYTKMSCSGDPDEAKVKNFRLYVGSAILGVPAVEV